MYDKTSLLLFNTHKWACNKSSTLRVITCSPLEPLPPTLSFQCTLKACEYSFSSFRIHAPTFFFLQFLCDICFCCCYVRVVNQVPCLMKRRHQKKRGSNKSKRRRSTPATSAFLATHCGLPTCPLMSWTPVKRKFSWPGATAWRGEFSGNYVMLDWVWLVLWHSSFFFSFYSFLQTGLLFTFLYLVLRISYVLSCYILTLYYLAWPLPLCIFSGCIFFAKVAW